MSPLCRIRNGSIGNVISVQVEAEVKDPSPIELTLNETAPHNLRKIDNQMRHKVGHFYLLERDNDDSVYRLIELHYMILILMLMKNSDDINALGNCFVELISGSAHRTLLEREYIIDICSGFRSIQACWSPAQRRGSTIVLSFFTVCGQNRPSRAKIVLSQMNCNRSRLSLSLFAQTYAHKRTQLPTIHPMVWAKDGRKLGWSN